MADETGFEPACPKTLALKASALDRALLLIRDMVLSLGFEPRSLGRKPWMIGHYTTRAYGADDRTRTCALPLTRRAVSPLSYIGMFVDHVGVEPTPTVLETAVLAVTPMAHEGSHGGFTFRHSLWLQI